MRDPETKYQELLARLPESSKGEGGAPWDGSAGSDSDIFPSRSSTHFKMSRLIVLVLAFFFVVDVDIGKKFGLVLQDFT